MPPKALLPSVVLARLGLLARIAPRMARDIPRARKRVFRLVYQDVANLPEEIARIWLERSFGTKESARQSQRLLTSLHARDLLAIEPALARFQVPTLIVWGTGDIFFRRKWAYWLPSPAPPTSSRSTARACSSPTSAPPNSPEHCAATGTVTRDIRLCLARRCLVQVRLNIALRETAAGCKAWLRQRAPSRW
jgi:pimeloyl-ACP methyl ester carboxylesterase